MFKEVGEVDNCGGKKAMLQTWYQYFCKDASLPAVPGTALVCYLKQGTQILLL